MDLFKKMDEIKQHFNNISDVEFEENLIKAGYGEINHSNQSQMKIESPDNFIYSMKDNSYHFGTLPNITTRSYVVA